MLKVFNYHWINGVGFTSLGHTTRSTLMHGLVNYIPCSIDICLLDEQTNITKKTIMSTNFKHQEEHQVPHSLKGVNVVLCELTQLLT